MTLDEFLAALEKTPRRWYLRAGGAIRCGGKTDSCPISYFGAPRQKQCGRYIQAAHRIGLREATADKIAYAADFIDPITGAALRSRLLAACGLDTEGR